MRQLECALRKSLATPTKLEERFGDLSVNWWTSNIADFLETAFHKLAPKAGDSWMSHIAGKIASATLVTVAQMLHVSGKGYECGLDDALEEEAFQLELRQQIMAVLPPKEELKPRLHRLRTRYAFTLLDRPWRHLANLSKSFCRISKKTPDRSKRLNASPHP